MEAVPSIVQMLESPSFLKVALAFLEFLPNFVCERSSTLQLSSLKMPKPLLSVITAFTE